MNHITPATKIEQQIARSPMVRWLPMLIWMAMIFLVSHQESSELPNFGLWDLLFKKGAHMVAYAILAVFAFWGTRHRYSALLIAVLYAMSDEWHQTFVPGRNGTPIDVLIDAAGAIIGLWLYQRWVYQYLWPRVQTWLLSNRL